MSPRCASSSGLTLTAPPPPSPSPHPQGGPGMPEMLTPTSAIMGAGLGKECALITGAFWGHARAGRTHPWVQNPCNACATTASTLGLPLAAC
jgi:hypothetical protein